MTIDGYTDLHVDFIVDSITVTFGREVLKIREKAANTPV